MNLEATPEHELKPKLVFLGKLLGMDLYIDVSRQRQPEAKRELASKLLRAKLGNEQANPERYSKWPKEGLIKGI